MNWYWFDSHSIPPLLQLLQAAAEMWDISPVQTIEAQTQERVTSAALITLDPRQHCVNDIVLFSLVSIQNT